MVGHPPGLESGILAIVGEDQQTAPVLIGVPLLLLSVATFGAACMGLPQLGLPRMGLIQCLTSA